MKTRTVFLSFLLAFPVAAIAADDAVPAGWAKSADGVYSHAESNVACPATIAAFHFTQLNGPADPGLLGICNYVDGDGRRGLIRVRRYVRGKGDTPLAIRNDQMLMEGGQIAGAPPGAKLVSAIRGGPGPAIDGDAAHDMVLTTVRNGLLIDCMGWEKNSIADLKGDDAFELACSKLFESNSKP